LALALNKSGELPTYYDDLVPYSKDKKYYHSGLYTSRSNLKALIRRASQTFGVSNKLYLAKFLENLSV
jgi:hypothetical protein